MSGNVWIHVVILLATFSALSERRRPEAEASSSIGDLPMNETSGCGVVTERSESTTRPDDELEKGDFIMAAESDVAEMSAPTEHHKLFEPFAGTFRANVKM